ncbi:MAG: UDP-N-acetylmuramate--L-alanine ligase [Caldilineaceae bacterium]|nr:UDP-N-acetylmuramate--L-alanine ligase [Caldilineaceae bacterium]
MTSEQALPCGIPWQERLRASPRDFRCHIIGIGGAGLSAIAAVLFERGCTVTGSEPSPGPATNELSRRDITVLTVQDGRFLRTLSKAARPHVILRSSAVPWRNAEWAAARDLGLPVVTREAFLPAMLAGKQVTAVAGTHGKSTVTAMCAWMLQASGVKAGHIVGARHPDLPGGRDGQGPLFVIEADEYDRMFLGLRPTVAVVTSMEWDHPDCYRSFGELRTAFTAFAGRMQPGSTLIYHADDRNLREWVGGGLVGPAQLVGFGTHPSADWITEAPGSPEGSAMTLRERATGAAHKLRLQAPGAHARANAAAAWLAARASGGGPEAITAAAASYRALDRRFEIRSTAAGIVLVDDYAHHPSAIRATLSAARHRFPHGTLWAVFQPHTYSRTAALRPEFGNAFAQADRVLILPTFAARETPAAGMDGAALSKQVVHSHVLHAGSFDEASVHLAKRLHTGDAVILMGAGDIPRLTDKLTAALAQNPPPSRNVAACGVK